jgi:hypothetical protein
MVTGGWRIWAGTAPGRVGNGLLVVVLGGMCDFPTVRDGLAATQPYPLSDFCSLVTSSLPPGVQLKPGYRPLQADAAPYQHCRTPMPRPKVKPQDRRRASKACDACKASKKRCDARLPCLLCVKKGVGSSCSYSAARLQGTPADTQRSAVHRPLSVESSTSLAAPVRADHLLTIQEGPGSETSARSDRRRQASRRRPETTLGATAVRPVGQQAVMLNSKSGDKGECLGANPP